MPGTRAAALYGSGTREVTEPYYCNYGLNPEYRRRLEAGGMVISGMGSPQPQKVGMGPERIRRRGRTWPVIAHTIHFGATVASASNERLARSPTDPEQGSNGGMIVKVFVAGGTGVLGRAAVSALIAAGHRVQTSARGAEKAALIRALGADPVEVDLYDADALGRAVAGSDAVVRLTTQNPAADDAHAERDGVARDQPAPYRGRPGAGRCSARRAHSDLHP